MFSLFGYRLLAPKELDARFFNKFKTFAPFFRDRPPLVFDVGANVGQSVTEYKKHWPDCVIHSFEPQVEVFAQLQATAARFSNVTCNNFALGDTTGERTFFHHNLHPATSSFIPLNEASQAIANNVHPKAQFDKFDVTAKNVRIDTLDNYVAVNAIEHIDILKFDVQGYETSVFKGAADCLRDGRISFIITEITFDDVYRNRTSFHDIEGHILDHGFLIYDISHIYKDIARGRTHWVDAIYANQRRIDF